MPTVEVATAPAAMSLGPVEIRFKDDPKKLPPLSRIFEWLEAKQAGLGRQIVLKENEVNDPNAWKERLIGDNKDIAAQFPNGMRMPHPVEWKSIRPGRDRWGDEEAVEEVYTRLCKNYRQAQLKRKIACSARIDDTGVNACSSRASKRLRTERENSGPPKKSIQHENTSVPHAPRTNLAQNGQSVFKAGNAFVVTKESLLVQVANLRKHNTELQAAGRAQEEGRAALHIQPSRHCEELQTQVMALETQVTSHQDECAEVRRAAAAQVAFERGELDKQRSALRVAKEALAAQVAAERLQHQQDYAALRAEKEALMVSVLAKCVDFRTAMQIENETLRGQADSDRLKLARYEALDASRIVEEVNLRKQVCALQSDKERAEAQTASDRAEFAALDIEKGRLEAQNAHLEGQCAELKREKEAVEARAASERAKLEERCAFLQAEKEAANANTSELVETRCETAAVDVEDEEVRRDLENELAAVRAHNVALGAIKDVLEADNADLKRRNRNLTLVVELLEAAAAP